MNGAQLPTLLTVTEVARALGVHSKTVRRMLRRGQLVLRRVGVRGVRVDATSVMRLTTGLEPAESANMTVDEKGSEPPKLYRQRGRSKVWTALVQGREVPLGTTDEEQARRAVQALANPGGVATKRAWRVYPLPDRAGFGIKFYDRDGVRRLHRIPVDQDVNSVDEAEQYASIWYERNVGDAGRATASSELTLSPSTKFEEFGKLWTTGDLAKRFPDHVKVKRSAGDDERVLRLYVYPAVGHERLARFEGQCGLDLVEKVMAGLPPVGKTFSRASRRHVLQAIHRLLVLATYPARLIASNPLPKGFLPRATSSRAKSYVYPAEELALMQCTKVPLVARLFFGILSREGLRTSEALRLTWADVDLVRGVLVLDLNKTDEPRSWPLDPSSARALRVWREHFARGKGASELVLRDKAGESVDPYVAASLLRDSLQLAGVDRPQLFESSETRIALRAHDLRAGFVTVSLATGRTESWVTDRTGHRSSQMLYLYRRQARSHSELNLGPYAPLDTAIPELAEAAASQAATALG